MIDRAGALAAKLQAAGGCSGASNPACGAAKRLKHELLTFSASERVVLGECFAETITTHRYTCYAWPAP